MTIDGYLRQLATFRRRYEQAKNRVRKCNARTSPRSSLNLGDGTPRQRNSGNANEENLIELSDALNEMREASQQYQAFRNQLYDQIYNLLYWEGLLIERVYIHNVIVEADDDLTGADEILNTKNRAQILSKLKEAKQHLAENLRSQGVLIEDNDNGKTDS